MKVYVQKVFIRIFFQEQPSISIKVLQIFFQQRKTTKKYENHFFYFLFKELFHCAHTTLFSLSFFDKKTEENIIWS